MDYVSLKILHVSCAALSYVLFFLRGVWTLRNPAQLQRSWVKIVPHVVDTMLLASAVALAVMTRQYPGANAWLTAKVVALLVYIGLGMLALRRGKTRRVRLVAWIAAQGVFLYILAVALTRNAWPGSG